MRTTHLWFSILIFLLVSSCGSSDPGSPGGDVTIPDKPVVKDEISLTHSSDASVVLKPEAATKEIEFTASKDWTLIVPSAASSWITVAPSSGEKGTATITITVQENPEVENRVAEITLAAGSAKKVITVTQVQKDALVIAQNSYSVTSDGGEFSIEVGHNVDYQLEIDCDWIHQQSSRAYVKDMLTFSVDKNPNFDNREGLLTFTSKDGSLKQEVKVYQSEMNGIIVSAPSKVLDCKAHVFDIEIKANVEYVVKDPQVDWLKRVESRALTSRTIRYEVLANEDVEARAAEIQIESTDGKYKETVTVEQMQKDALVLAKNSYTVDMNGGNIEIEVGHNVSYDVTMDVDWITQQESRAYAKDKVIFSVKKNPTYDNREGKIIFTSKDGSLKQEAKVYQSEMKGLIVSATDKVFDEQAHTFDIEIKANVDYTVSDPQVDWLKRIESRALTSRTLRYELQENTSYDSRTAKIIVSSKEGLSDTILVSQMQKDAIIIAKSSYEFDWDKHQLNFDVKANVNLEVSTSVDWIKRVETSRGLSVTPLSFMIDTNEEKNERTGVITIKHGNLKQEITVIQDKFDYFLELPEIKDSSNLVCSYDDDGTFRFMVHSDGPYRIELSGDSAWLVRRGKDHIGENLYYELFDAKQNDTREEMRSIVTFRLGPISHSFYFIKFPKRALTLSQTEFNPSIDGGSFTLEIKQLFDALNSYNIQIPKDAPWLTVKHDSYGTGGTAVFTAAPNMTAKMRETYVIVQVFAGEKYKVHVTQAGRETVVLSDSEILKSARPSTVTVDLISDDYTVDILGNADWVKTGKKWTEDNKVKQELILSENPVDQPRKAQINFTIGNNTNQVEITQLEKAPELEERAPEKWQRFSIPKVNFITPEPYLKGVQIYNAIVPDPEKLIGIVSRMVLDVLYYSPEDEFIPKRKSMKYIVENFNGVSYFSGNLQSKIALSTSYLEAYYNANGGKAMIEENIGILSHELTHCYQLNPQGVGDYSNKVYHACIEGMADAVRVLCGKFTERDRPHGGSYLDSYRFTGFFLAWLTNNKDKDFLRKFNLSTQYVIPWSFDGAIKYALGDEYNVDDLWDEYQRAVGDR